MMGATVIEGSLRMRLSVTQSQRCIHDVEVCHGTSLWELVNLARKAI